MPTKEISEPGGASSFTAGTILQRMLQAHVGRAFKLSTTCASLPGRPGAFRVGICLPSVFGAEVLGLTLQESHVLQAHVEVVYFLPFQGHVQLSRDRQRIYIARGCAITGRDTLVDVSFPEPVRVHRPFFEAYKECSVDQDMDEVYQLTQNKTATVEFLRSIGIPTVDEHWSVAPSSTAAELASRLATLGGPVVVKPAEDSGGRGVRLFCETARTEAAEYACSIAGRPGGAVLESRLVSSAMFREGVRLDWNTRVLVAFSSGGDPIVDLRLAYVRARSYGFQPVSEEFEGTIQLSLAEARRMLAASGIGVAAVNLLFRVLISKSRSVGAAFVGACGGSGVHRTPTFLGIDWILDEAGAWRVLELNTGNVGDIPFALSLAGGDPGILEAVLEGLAGRPDSRVDSELVDVSLSNLREYYWSDFWFVAREMHGGSVE